MTALLLLGVALPGCSNDAGPDSVGTFVAGWSEMRDDADAVRRFKGRARLVDDRSDLDAVIDLASPELATEDLADVDLDQVVLVVGAHPRCDESFLLERDDDGATLRFLVVDPDDPVECAWSPLEVTVLAVPREDLADDVTVEGPTRR